MKIDIKTIKTENGVIVAGWDLIPESQSDEDKLCVMRDAIFFGFDDNHIEYAGREGNASNENWPIDKLKYRKQKYRNIDNAKLDLWEPE